MVKTILSNRYVQLLLVAVVFFGGGMATGRFGLPAKTLVTEKVVEKEVEKIVYQDKIVIEKVYVQAKKQKIHEEIVVVKSPDGTETTTTRRDSDEDTTTKEDTNTTKETIVYKDRVVEKLVEKLKLVEAKKPDWRVGAGLGLSVPYFLNGQDQGVPGLRGAVINIELDRRIAGPFFLGVQGNTLGSVGLNLSGVF